MVVDLSLGAEVNFAPNSVAAEIVQNVRTILTTRRGDVPLDRDFGLTWEHIDKPVNVAEALMRTEIIDVLETYEPRCRVLSVTFPTDSQDPREGILRPKVIIEIEEDSDG